MSQSQPPTTICVFCGSSSGTSPGYLAAARSLAQAFHANNVHLVYGGGTIGLMGEIAKTLVSLSGPSAVHGIIPKALIKYEQAGRPIEGATTAPAANAAPTNVPNEAIFGRTTVVSSMHERKQLMTQMVLAGGPGSGFIALPGGYGTLEELAEVTTWNQLGIHGAGIVLFDVEGFWRGLVGWIDHAKAQGFINEKNRGIICCADDAEGCLRELREYRVSSARFDLDWSQK